MPELRQVRERCWRTVRTAIGNETFEQHFRRGTRAEPTAVLALAVEGRPTGGGGTG
ncbi:hypothetical protein [Streptomyces sp. NRRL B-1347]|uniref:hypothetical protein n=1 Tax=Streptomyces sp. NRRL B-1347 TaxID=1476877 RepID=UPI000AFB51BA|nr:hypothetical protein [Streptomyces sp. NRRL B-1347]